MSSTNVVPVSTGYVPLDDFMLSIVSFMKNLSDRFDDVVEQVNLLSGEVGSRNDAIADLGNKVYLMGVSIEQMVTGGRGGVFSDCMNNCTVNAQGRE